jgi:RNA recognition motif-containing protein
MQIYVGNISYNTSEDALSKVFSEYGEVASVKIITDRETGRSKGFGFITMEDDSSAQNAIENLNGQNIDGRALRVNEAKPREPREPRERRSFNNRY